MGKSQCLYEVESVFCKEKDMTWVQNGLRESICKIEALPAGIVRIRLRERRYAILKEKGQVPLQEEAIDIQKCADESQMSGGIQNTGMGGIQ